MAVAAALVLMVGGFNFALHYVLDREANQAVMDRASARLATLQVTDGKISIREDQPDTALDVGTWVFQGTRAIERPGSEGVLEQAAERLIGGSATIVSVENAQTRLASLPIIDDGTQIGTVVAGLSDRAYRRTFKFAVVGSLVFATVLLGLVGLITAAVLRAALRPVSRMTADVADWSEHDLDKRFALGEPYDELTGLARTLDGLLDRIAASLRRERLLTAEISHELRTPLSKISAQAELALRRERTSEDYRLALESVVASANEMNRTIETLLVVARQQTAGGGGSADLGAVVDRLTNPVGGIDGASGVVAFDVNLPAEGLRVRVDPGVLERILAPILENAARYARTTIEVTGEATESGVMVTISDDGRGVPSGHEERIFEPGVVGDASAEDHHGPGLGLALARRLARDGGGEITAVASPLGGRFHLRLPSAPASR